MQELFQQRIRKIYNCIEDDLSKKIFSDRLMYSLTSDYRYIMNVVCSTQEGSEIYSRLESTKKKKVIFGAGIWGAILLLHIKM